MNYERNKNGFTDLTDRTLLTFTYIEAISAKTLNVRSAVVSIGGGNMSHRNIRMLNIDSAVAADDLHINPMGKMEVQPGQNGVRIVGLGPLDIYGGTACSKMPSYIIIR